MTVDEAKARLAQFVELIGDNEAAHKEEDDFRRDVLRAIANGHPYPRELAAIALRTGRADFARWYA